MAPWFTKTHERSATSTDTDDSDTDPEAEISTPLARPSTSKHHRHANTKRHSHSHSHSHSNHHARHQQNPSRYASASTPLARRPDTTRTPFAQVQIHTSSISTNNNSTQEQLDDILPHQSHSLSKRRRRLVNSLAVWIRRAAIGVSTTLVIGMLVIQLLVSIRVAKQNRQSQPAHQPQEQDQVGAEENRNVNANASPRNGSLFFLPKTPLPVDANADADQTTDRILPQNVKKQRSSLFQYLSKSSGSSTQAQADDEMLRAVSFNTKFQGIKSIQSIHGVNITQLTWQIYHQVQDSQIGAMVSFPCTETLQWMPQLLDTINADIYTGFKHVCVDYDSEKLTQARDYFKHRVAQTWYISLQEYNDWRRVMEEAAGLVDSGSAKMATFLWLPNVDLFRDIAKVTATSNTMLIPVLDQRVYDSWKLDPPRPSIKDIYVQDKKESQARVMMVL